MSFLVDFAKKVFHDVKFLQESTAEEKYFAIMQKYKDFTQKYPLVVSYMCRYGLFHEKLFEDMINKIETTRPTFEGGYELQAEYIKKLLVENGVSKIKALKISNMELEEIMKQINSIKKQEKELKKKDEEFMRETAETRRRELLEFALNN